MRLAALKILCGLILLALPLQLDAHSVYLSVGADTAAVTLDGMPLGHTDHQGIFYGEPVTAGFHVLKVEKEGYRSLVDTIFVPEDLTYNHTRPLEAFRVVVINELTGQEDESVAGPYTIQIGAFRSVENARRLAAGFEETAYQARLETAEIKDLGVMHRVRVALFNSLETARQAATEFVRSGNRDIWIVGLDGRDWAVQLATFASQEKAGQLVAAVTEPDLYTWIENTSDGLYRVKVGYWADRPAAETAAAELGERLKLKPEVVQVR